jgi:hypothetical protein
MMGKGIRLPFRIDPVNVVTHFMIHHINPLPFRFILPAFFPVFWVDEMDCPIFVRFAGRLAPIEILVPLDARTPQAIEPTHQRYRPVKGRELVVGKKTRQMLVNLTPMMERRKDHAHNASVLR